MSIYLSARRFSRFDHGPYHRFSSTRCEQHVEDCGSSATTGYTSEYSPVAATPLAEAYDADLIDGDDIDQIDSENSLDCSLYIGERSVPLSLESST